MSPVTSWISVDDLLPNTDREVLIAWEYAEKSVVLGPQIFREISRYEEDLWRVEDDPYPINVLFWMDIPKLPEVK